MHEPEAPAAGETTGVEAVPPVAAKRPRTPTVSYLGFRATEAGREYSLRVTDGLEPRLFVLLIPHEAFASGETRFQDAPALCFATLQGDLVADPDLLPHPRRVLTAKEMLAYRRDTLEKRSPGRKRGGSAG